MREKGLEPSRLYRHKILSLACLPIPAFPHGIRFSNQGDNQIWTGDQGVADPRLTAWLCRRCPSFRTTPWTGLEPVTLRLTAACSTYWAIRANTRVLYQIITDYASIFFEEIYLQNCLPNCISHLAKSLSQALVRKYTSNSLADLMVFPIIYT